MTGLSLNEPPSVLVARHIEHHLKRPRDQRQFSAHLDKLLLQRMWAKRHILTGGSEITSRALKRYVKSDDYRKLTELKLLRFSSDRARHVKRDQEVKLNLRLRGHSELILKVYTLNTRAYWSQNSAEIPLDLDLSGLEANEERRVTIERPGALRDHYAQLP